MKTPLPAVIKTLVEQLNDKKEVYWIRKNYADRLEDIAHAIMDEVTKFNKEPVDMMDCR